MPRGVDTGEAALGAEARLENEDRVARRVPSGNGMRLTLMLVLFGLKLLAPKAVLAQQAADQRLVGKRVVQRSNDLKLHIEDKIVETNRVIQFYRVEHANGPWLWVRAEGNGFSGWALADHMIPIEQGIEYFSERIGEAAGDVFPYVMRAMLWQDRKDIPKALKDYDDVIRLDPTRGWIFNDRGVLHFEQQRLRKGPGRLQ